MDQKKKLLIVKTINRLIDNQIKKCRRRIEPVQTKALYCDMTYLWLNFHNLNYVVSVRLTTEDHLQYCMQKYWQAFIYYRNYIYF